MYKYHIAKVITLISSVLSLSPITLIADTSLKSDKIIEITKSTFSTYLSFSKEGECVYYIPRGIYVVKDPLQLPSYCTLIGDGPDTVLQISQNFSGSRLISNRDFENGNINIYISSFKLIFEKKELSGDLPGLLRFEKVKNLSIKNIVIEAKTNHYCIDISASTRNAVISKCNIVNTGSGGCIQVRNRFDSIHSNSSDIRLQQNFVSSIEDEPIAVFGWQGYVSNVVIEDNNISATGASFGISAYGIDQEKHTGRLDNVIIHNNVIVGSRIGGITVKGGAQNVIIKKNQISYTDKDGIFIDDGGANLPFVENIDVIGNKILVTGRHCFYVSGRNIRIDENLMQSCSDAGVFISSRKEGTISVTNNTIDSSGRNIIIYGPFDGTISGNKLSQVDGILRIKN